jgi:hypothetical protein
MSQDDDTDRPDSVNEEELASPTPGEQARAEAFGRLIDGLMEGQPLPPAMDSDDRALVETATMVVASSRPLELSETRTRRLVDSALESAILGHPSEGSAPRSDMAGTVAPASGETPMGPGRRPPLTAVPGAPVAGRERADVTEESSERSTTDVRVRRRRRDRAARALPWAVASLAAAAAVVLFMVRPGDLGPGGQAKLESEPPAIELSVFNSSRPADTLIGAIPREASGGARERLDILFADRMAGYRDLAFRRALRAEEP